jgi:hypothetical protein
VHTAGEEEVWRGRTAVYLKIGNGDMVIAKVNV